LHLDRSERVEARARDAAWWEVQAENLHVLCRANLVEAASEHADLHTMFYHLDRIPLERIGFLSQTNLPARSDAKATAAANKAGLLFLASLQQQRIAGTAIVPTLEISVSEQVELARKLWKNSREGDEARLSYAVFLLLSNDEEALREANAQMYSLRTRPHGQGNHYDAKQTCLGHVVVAMHAVRNGLWDTVQAKVDAAAAAVDAAEVGPNRDSQLVLVKILQDMATEKRTSFPDPQSHPGASAEPRHRWVGPTAQQWKTLIKFPSVSARLPLVSARQHMRGKKINLIEPPALPQPAAAYMWET
jgi:hypothetical protein